MNIMKYLLASDYDGTLCQNGTVSEKTVSAIKEFRSRGNLFGVVTGRDYANGFEVFKKADLFPFDFVITNNGAAAYDKEGNIYFLKKVVFDKNQQENNMARKLIERCIQLTSNCCGISFERTRYDFHPEFLLTKENKNSRYSSLSTLDNLKEFISVNAVCDTFEQAEDVVKILKEEFSGYINPIQNCTCIDIPPVGIDKCAGIGLLADRLQIPEKHIWTVGDNLNDIGMIQKYNGCAISTGAGDAKKTADYICDDVADVIAIIMNEGEGNN